MRPALVDRDGGPPRALGPAPGPRFESANAGALASTDRRVREAHRQRRAGETALACALRDARDLGLPERRGFADLAHYASLAADLPPRQTERLVALADAFARLPRLADAFAAGELGLAKAREVCVAASPETEDAWLAAARDLPLWTLATLAARARYGDTPDEARSRPATDEAPEEMSFVLRLPPATYALLAEALRRVRRANGTIEEAIVAFAESVLGSREGGHSSVADPVPVAPAGDSKRPDLDGAADRSTAPRAASGAEDVVSGAAPRSGRPLFQWVLYRCEACGDASLGRGGPRAGPPLLERAACDAEEVRPSDGARRSRTIPPRVRRAVWLRDGGRCRVPDCRRALWSDLHHLRMVSRGGEHRPENLVVLCTAHHAAVHDGRLVVAADASGRLVWRHADGVEFGGVAPSPRDARGRDSSARCCATP